MFVLIRKSAERSEDHSPTLQTRWAVARPQKMIFFKCNSCRTLEEQQNRLRMPAAQRRILQMGSRPWCGKVSNRRPEKNWDGFLLVLSFFGGLRSERGQEAMHPQELGGLRRMCLRVVDLSLRREEELAVQQARSAKAQCGATPTRGLKCSGCQEAGCAGGEEEFGDHAPRQLCVAGGSREGFGL